MRIFEAMHEGLRRVEARVVRSHGWRFSPTLMLETTREWFLRAGERITRGDVWPFVVFGTIATLLMLGVVVIPILIPFVLLATIATGVVLFARAWARGFLTLMRLGDHAFPGRHDKWIWALLMILAPPVGVWMFGAYREAHWGGEKAAEPVVEV